MQSRVKYSAIYSSWMLESFNIERQYTIVMHKILILFIYEGG